MRFGAPLTLRVAGVALAQYDGGAELIPFTTAGDFVEGRGVLGPVQVV